MRILVSGTTQSFRKLLERYRCALGFLLVPGNGNKIATVLSFGVPSPPEA